MNGNGHNSSIPIATSTTRNGATPPVVADSAARDYPATQRSLEQVTATIDSAYRRIRQVRRNLLNIIDSIPNTGPQRYSQDNSGIGPGHEAITLTDASRDAPSSLLQDINLDVRSEIMSVNMMEERLRQIEARIEADLHAMDSYSDSHPPATIIPDAPPPSHPPLPQTSSAQGPRRPHVVTQPFLLAPSAPSRRPELEDGTTSIGRRVAAREAARSNTAATPISGVSTRFDDNGTFFASLERDIENFRSLARQRRTGTGTGSGASVDSSRFPESSRSSPFRRGSYVPSLFTGVGVGAASDYRRRRMYGTSSTQSPASTLPSDRLSLLSNLSVQNLPTPASPGVPRPLIFDEPASYVPVASLNQQSSDVRDDPVFYDNERSYVVRRRFNADGEEHVHPINLEWIDEEPPSWLFPRGIPQREPVYEYSSSRSAGAATRLPQGRSATANNVPELPLYRRGWARLDRDGNEIPSDEEEEIERIQMEHRVQLRAQQTMSRGFTLGPGIPTPFRDLTTIPPDDENNLHPDSIPRVRLNGRRRRSVAEPLMAADLTGKTTLRPLFEDPASATTSPFQANPLPMPLEEMIWPPLKTKATHAAWIPHHANFAGR